MTDVRSTRSAVLTRQLELFYTLPEPNEDLRMQLEARLAQRRLQLIETGQSGSLTNRFRRFIDGLYASQKSALIKFGLGVLTALAGILVLSGLAYAIATAFDIYIPGLGLANRESQIRSLPEPAAQTREGITVTIQQVLLTPEKTSLVMTVQGLKPGAFVTEEDSQEAHERSCNASPELALPDGTLLSPVETGMLGYDESNAYQRVLFYPPIAESVRRAQLEIPCIFQTRAGSAPTDWQIPLRFVPADPALTTIPVIEPAPPDPSARDLIVLDQVIAAAGETIFTGRFLPPFEGSAVTGIKDWAPLITDAGGKALSWRVPAEIRPFTDAQGVFHWAYQVEGQNLAWPLKIQFDAIDLRCTGPAQFEFDPRQLPGSGQALEVNKALSVGNCALKLVSIQKIQSGYTFRMAPDGHAIQDVQLEILGSTPTQTSQVLRPAYDDVSLIFAGELPAGRLTVQLTAVTLQVPGPWQVEWRPENEGAK